MEQCSNELVPFMAIHPGYSLREELRARHISCGAFAARAGFKLPFLKALLWGRRDFTEDVARRLDDALGIPADFWMRAWFSYIKDRTIIKARGWGRWRFVR